MIVSCRNNNIHSFGDELRLKYKKGEIICGSLDALVVGRSYIVICVELTTEGSGYVYLPEVYPESGYPPPYPIELFDVVDEKIPSDWLSVYVKDRSGNIFMRKSFREWAQDDMFFENLLDEKDFAVELYNKWLGEFGLPRAEK